MSVTVPTSHVYNVKTITFETKTISNTKDKWIGNFNSPDEKGPAKYIKEQFKL